MPGSLTIVGTGICAASHMTPQAQGAFAGANYSYYLVTEPIAEDFLLRLNSKAISLYGLYEQGQSRAASYEQMVETILVPVRQGKRVCAAFYGHPGVFVNPGHEAIRRARDDGHQARMLPAISAEDCLVADLGVDPGEHGCQSYEATSFLDRNVQPDTGAALILWQVAVIGMREHVTEIAGRRGLARLRHRLGHWYRDRHLVTLYEASPYSLAGPSIIETRLDRLADIEPTPMATLYVPPAGRSVSSTF